MKRIFLRLAFAALLVGLGLSINWFYHRYATAVQMDIPITEYANFEYPEDPAEHSLYFQHYANRQLTLIKKDEIHFDFIFKPTDSETATITFKNIDVSLMTPSEPEWTKREQNLEIIALTDRQWNRQQVSFNPNAEHVEIAGGDGFEKSHIYSAELAKNCLNAGLWEVLLFTRENGKKSLYYQGWFTFPLGYYKDIFEHNTGASYLSYWHRLEHWFNPAGTPIELSKLRSVVHESKVTAKFNPNEPRLFEGEQLRKQRTTNANNLRTWGDIVSGAPIHFAAFIPPGRYSDGQPWGNEYWRFAQFQGAVYRDIQSKASPKVLSEIELDFTDSHGNLSRMIVSGFDISALPQLPVTEYPRGYYMPMGIGVPPFIQDYEDLEKIPPQKSAYFSLLLDSNGQWINHHDAAIDGQIIHRDEHDPYLLHVYLLSYERHALIGHYLVPMPKAAVSVSMGE
ncbi:hypothetical protein MCAMS1_02689 [biofilm metagenome]